MKMYIKSATNVADVEAKISKKQAEIDKKRAWIAKKEDAIKKKLALLSGKISDDEYTQLVACLDELKVTPRRKINDDARIDTWALVRKYGYNYDTPEGKALYSIKEDAESIYNSKEAIKEAQAIVDKYNAQLDTIKQKDKAIDEIPECLKEFMNKIIAKWDNYDITLRDESQPFYQELKAKADEILYADNPYHMYSLKQQKLKEMYPDVEDTWRDSLSQRFEDDYINHPFVQRFHVDLNYARSFWKLTDEQIHKANVESGKRIILDLVNRVTKITGPVRDWSGLHVTTGNSGGAVLNGIVIGDDGKAKVESIYAEGPIQRLHIRTLVKEIK